MKYLLYFLLLIPSSLRADIDTDFLTARDAFRSGNSTRLSRVSSRLQDTPLEPYVTYYQLRMRWQAKDSSPIRNFLAREADTPIIDQFRSEWLKYLAKRQLWDDFAAEYPRLIHADAELGCYALQWQHRSDEMTALAEARKIWLNGAEQPESCNTLFVEALKNGNITTQDVMQRIRLALEAGNTTLAKKLNRNLVGAQKFSEAELNVAAKNPLRYLSKTPFAQANDARRLVALFALQRLTKQSTDLAYAQWQKIADNFSGEEAQYFHAWLALAAARRHDARALLWYGQAGDSVLNEQQLAWRARAALRIQNWNEVLAGISQMSVQQKNEGCWRYWQARSLRQLGRVAEADELLAPLSREHNYYGQLAAEELGIDQEAGMYSLGLKPDNIELLAMQSRAEIQRTLVLYRLGLRVEASKEWEWALRGLNDRELLVAAEVARRNEMYDRSIYAANRTVEFHDFNLRYPSPFRDALQSPLREHQLEEAWVYGLMRQESRFTQHAKSNVGAAGLMQIMPDTARWAARRIGLKGYRKGLIHQLDVNLRLGTFYMKNVYNMFDDNPVLASAAYNAGPSRARQWRGSKPLEGAIYVETIPFDETRDYVKKVMSNTLYYSKLFGQPAQSLKQRLGVIAAKTTGSSLLPKDEI